MDDKYDRTSESREALPGWETNIMAGSFDENGEARRVDQRNIDAILADIIKLGTKVYYINETNSEIK